MENKQVDIDNFQKKANKNENFIVGQANKKLSYLYPDGHRMTHQMRWYKGSRDRGLRSDMAA